MPGRTSCEFYLFLVCNGIDVFLPIGLMLIIVWLWWQFRLDFGGIMFVWR